MRAGRVTATVRSKGKAFDPDCERHRCGQCHSPHRYGKVPPIGDAKSRSMTIYLAGALIAAGVGGGIAASVASVASMVSYPALLALGLPPLAANVTNTMALVFSVPGGMLGSRPELAGQRDRVLRLSAGHRGGRRRRRDDPAGGAARRLRLRGPGADRELLGRAHPAAEAPGPGPATRRRAVPVAARRDVLRGGLRRLLRRRGRRADAGDPRRDPDRVARSASTRSRTSSGARRTWWRR